MAQAGSPRRQERLTRIVAATSLAFSLVYIVWRWGWTLNTEALWFSVPLAVAETYGLLTAFFLAFTAWRLKERAPKPPLRGRTVDVFVTTYDEPIGIIRKTALAARELRYPHHTWLLDDGKRDEVRALATELGIGYLRREGREHAKAGNLNHALRNTLGEFILQLDADHVPLPHMIDRLIGHFEDERLAFVQSPQDFYNTDAFTYDVNVRQRRIWEDQQLFFRVLQPGKDRVNAAFFVGSCALIRRAAVEEIGGFATETITEDIETSLLLHARGWRSAYVAESLAYGLAPATARAFHVQHLRWGQGAMQVLRRYRPLFMPGLTLAQRIAYLDSLSTYLGGFQRLILYLAPVVFFTTGTFPLQVSGAQFATFFLPYITLQLLSFKLLARGHGSLLLADRYAMAKFFTHVLAVTGYLTRKRLAFRVTPKGENQVPLSTVAPQFTVAAVTGLSLLWAVWERTRGYTDEIPGWGASAFWVNVVFALWNGGVAWHIMQLSLGGRRRRAEHRFAEALALSVRVFRPDGKLTATDIGVTENLNPAGLALRTMYPMPEGARVEMTLPLQTRAVEVRGRVVHHATTDTQFGTVHLHGIAFEGLDRESRDAVEMHCAHHAMPIERQRYREGGLTARGVLRRLRDLRAVPRLAVGIPAHVAIGSNGSVRALGVGLLEDVSPRGGRVLLDHPVGEGSLLTLSIPGSAVQASGRVVAVRALETSLGTRFMAGFETVAENADEARAARRWYDYLSRFMSRKEAVAGQVPAAEVPAALVAGNPALEAPLPAPQPEPALLAQPEPAEPATRRESAEPLAVTEAHEGIVSEPLEDDAALVAAPRTSFAELELGELDFDDEPDAALDLGADEREPEPLQSLSLDEAEPEPLRAFVAEDEPEPLQALALDEAEPEPLEPFAYAAAAADETIDTPAAFDAADELYDTPTPNLQEPEPMTIQQQPQQAGQTTTLPGRTTTPALLVIRGAGARLEGRFDIEESIEVQCQVTGELRVGGTIVIGEQGEVSADITTVNAVILGSYTGNLKASGSIEIAATGRVSGTLESDELVIAKGGVFTGTVARPEPQPAVQVEQEEADVEPELAAQSERTTKVAKRVKPAAAPLADIAPSAQLLDLDDDVQLRAPRAQGIPIA